MSAKTVPIFAKPTVEVLPKVNPTWLTTLPVLATDVMALITVFFSAVLVRHLTTSTSYPIRSFAGLLPFIPLMLAGFALQGLYPGRLIHPAEQIRRIFIAASATSLFLACSTFLIRNGESYSRLVFLVTWLASVPAVYLSRSVGRRILARKPWWGINAVVLGSGPSARRVARTLGNTELGLRVCGVLCDNDDLEPSWALDLPPLLGPLALAPGLARDNRVQYAIIAMPSHTDFRRVIQDFCRGFSHVLIVPDLPGFSSLNVEARELGGEFGFEVPQKLFHSSRAAAKRMFDLTVAVALVTFAFPLLTAVAVAIKLTSRGPIFYRQLRYGRYGQTFSALKFRTMAPNADRLLAEHLAAHPERALEWQRDHKLKEDPRVIFIGRWLRRYSLDELPQLLNVLAGQMSLVGPRPIVEAEIKKYGGSYSLYSRVQPGITGLWQVSGRNNTTYEERVSLDEFYVNNWSIWLDAYILLRTIKVVFRAEGAY